MSGLKKNCGPVGFLSRPHFFFAFFLELIVGRCTLMAGHAECQVDRFKEAAIAEVENFYRRESRMPCLVFEKRFHDIAKLLCYLLFGRLRA